METGGWITGESQGVTGERKRHNASVYIPPWQHAVEADSPLCELCTFAWCADIGRFRLKFANRFCRHYRE